MISAQNLVSCIIFINAVVEYMYLVQKRKNIDQPVRVITRGSTADENDCSISHNGYYYYIVVCYDTFS